MESKKVKQMENKPIDTENSLVVARGGRSAGKTSKDKKKQKQKMVDLNESGTESQTF